MAEVTPPLFQNVDGTYTAADLGLPYRDSVSEGVVAAGAMAVAQRAAGANMSVDVAAGVAWVQGDESDVQPCYRCHNDGTVNIAVTAADVTNPRIDIVIAEVRDAAFAGVSTDWRLRVVAGTPAGAPAAPSTPNNALKLAEVSVPAADTTIEDAQITDTRVRASTSLPVGIVRDEYTATAVAFTSATYADPSTPGPSITIPRDGDYLVEWWAQATHSVQYSLNWMAVQVNAVATVDADGVLGQPFVATGQVLFPTGRKVMTLAAGDVLKLQYKTNNSTLTINGAGGVNPYISATPVAVA